MSVLDSIIKLTLIEDQMISSNYESEIIDVDKVHSGYAIVLELDDGVGTDVTFSLSVSVDGNNFSTLSGSSNQFTDTSGSVTWDILATNTSFVKVVATHTAGSITVKKAILSAKRLH